MDFLSQMFLMLHSQKSFLDLLPAVLKGLNQPRILGPVLTIQFSAGKLAQGTRP